MKLETVLAGIFVLQTPLPGQGPPAPSATETAGLANVAEVVAWFSGSWDSSSPSVPDHAGSPRGVLVVVPVPKSRFGFGAPVLYVEEALFAKPNRPTRQRFYRTEDGGSGKVLWRVFEPKDPLAVAGKWRDPSDLQLLSAQDVVERKGCLVTLTKSGDRWEGHTNGAGCLSARAGARYTTSYVTLGADHLELLDRGFDGSGKQVWGSEKGPILLGRAGRESSVE